MNGKGDSRRPAEVPPEVVASNWDRIFGKPKIGPAPKPWEQLEMALEDRRNTPEGQ